MSAPPIPNDSSTQIGAQIVDSSLELVRAEIRLLWSHAHRLGAGAAIAIGLTWVSMALTQIALLILVLSPLFVAVFPVWAVLASVLPVVFLTTIAWMMTRRSWRLLLAKQPDLRTQRKASSPELVEL